MRQAAYSRQPQVALSTEVGLGCMVLSQVL